MSSVQRLIMNSRGRGRLASLSYCVNRHLVAMVFAKATLILECPRFFTDCKSLAQGGNIDDGSVPIVSLGCWREDRARQRHKRHRS